MSSKNQSKRKKPSTQTADEGNSKRAASSASPKAFSASTKKTIKAHFGAGRVLQIKASLEKHGYVENGCLDLDSADVPLLLDCAQNAARMGHLPGQIEALNLVLELGLIPDKTLMYHLAISCPPAILRVAAAAAPPESLDGLAAHSLQHGMGRNFLLLVKEFHCSLGVWCTSAQAFARKGQTMWEDPNTEGGQALALEVRNAALGVWEKAGETADMIEECLRLKAISPDSVSMDFDGALEELRASLAHQQVSHQRGGACSR
jgi:hypothetical protein